jgi:ferredoxin
MSRAARRAAGSWRLHVDRTACDGRGACAELLPEAVTLDEWGYPIVAPVLPAALRPVAAEAVAACPLLALRLLPA